MGGKCHAKMGSGTETNDHGLQGPYGNKKLREKEGGERQNKRGKAVILWQVGLHFFGLL